MDKLTVSQRKNRARLLNDVEIAKLKQSHLPLRQIVRESIAELMDERFPESEVERNK